MASNEVRGQVFTAEDLQKFTDRAKDTSELTAAPPADQHQPAADEGTAARADIPDSAAASTVMSIFAGDHLDVMLLGYYTALIKMFIGAGGTGDPTMCPVQEEVITWLGFGVIVTVYIIRHFVQKPEPGRLLHSIARCVLFATFALCIHSQPISCSLPRLTPGQHAPGLTVLHYVQGAVIMSLAIATSEMTRREFFSKRAVVTAADRAAGGEGTDGQELMPLRGTTGMVGNDGLY